MEPFWLQHCWLIFCTSVCLKTKIFPLWQQKQIVFYEGKCFTGRKLEICSDCDNFQDRGFMNRVNSVRVESGAFICYDHPDFKGQQYILEHGEYPEFQRWNAHNDHMGSCRPIRMVGELVCVWKKYFVVKTGIYAALFVHICFSGQSKSEGFQYVIVEETLLQLRGIIATCSRFTSHTTNHTLVHLRYRLWPTHCPQCARLIATFL